MDVIKEMLFEVPVKAKVSFAEVFKVECSDQRRVYFKRQELREFELANLPTRSDQNDVSQRTRG